MSDAPPIPAGRTIVRLQAENVKIIKAVNISPGAIGITEIAGRNGQGKTTVLDSIMYALGGTASLPEQPIREGETRAKVIVDLGDIVVTREWTPKGTTLAVRNKDGGKIDAPQTLLDKMLGKLTFDPLAFTREKPKEKRATLMQVAGLDFADLDTKREQFFEQRTDLNRDLKRQSALLESMPIQSPRPKPVDVGDLTRELEAAIALDTKRTKLNQQVFDLQSSETNNNARINQLEVELKSCRSRAGELAMAIAEAQTAESEIPPSTVVGIREQLGKAQTTNAAAAKAAERDALAAKVKEMAKEADGLTKEIEEIDAKKQARIQAAELPIDGLSVGAEGVLYNGIPFEQASTAEQIKVSVAMGIALNPNLRVMFVRDGSLLDEDSMAAIEAMAVEKKVQVWIERVDSDRASAVMIEDGEVVASPEPAEASA